MVTEPTAPIDPSVALKLQIAALQDAMASGVLTVEDADTGRVTYRTYPEMRAALSDAQKRLADLAAVDRYPRRTRHVVMTGRTGW